MKNEQDSASQRILGLRKPVVTYCVKCKLYYNKTNSNDVYFHSKIHRRSLIPKCEKISTGFYQNKNRFYYGFNEIKAECMIKQLQYGVCIEEIFYDNEDSRSKMIELLMILYPSVNIIIKD